MRCYNMANNRYEPEFKEKVLCLYLEEGRTKKVLPKNITSERAH